MALEISPNLVAWFGARWAEDMGAIDGHDLTFLAACLGQSGGARVLEIGCASGFSTAALAQLLHDVPGARIDSYDLGERYYVDPSKPVGYLAEEIAPRVRTGIAIHRGRTALDAAADHGADSFDFCFIDANHAHPWPLIDTLCVLPLVRRGALIAHHDLNMFRSRHPPAFHAVGPKMLFDRVPERLRVPFAELTSPDRARDLKLPTRKGHGNIFALRRPAKIQPLVARLAEGFYLPWSIGDPLPRETVERLGALFARLYPREVALALETGVARYSRHRSLPERALRRAVRAARWVVPSL